jgi:hypothetical protein
VQISIKNRSWRELEVGIAYLSISTIGLLIIWLFPHALSFIPPCMFRLWSGIPCPSCGGTHCAVQLANLNFVQAFLSNPFIFLLLVLLAFWGMNTTAGVVFKRNIQFLLSNREKLTLKWIIILSIPVNWLYLLLKSTIFH